MTRSLWSLPLACVSVAALVAQSGAPAPQTPFRGRADVVSVDVIVRSGSDAVGGLRPQDFRVLDNGVPQQVDVVDAAAVPIDLTVVIDVSGPTSDIWQKPPSAADATRRVADRVARLRELLRPGDRLQLITADTYVTQSIDLTERPTGPSAIESGGRASIHDALIAALVQPDDPTRRHVVLAFLKGEDVLSAVDADAMQLVARRSDAVLHVIFDAASLLAEMTMQDCQCELIHLCKPVRHFVLPIRRRPPDGACFPTTRVPPIARPGLHIDTLAEAARASGGEYWDAGALGQRDLPETFTEILARLRHAYVLRYTPRGVKKDGWHDLVVTVPSLPAATITARRGYAIEPDTPAERPRPDATTADRATKGSAPVSLASLVDAFDRGDDAEVRAGLKRVTDLSKLLHDVRDSGGLWPAAPRREAAFVIELANVLLASPNPVLVTEAMQWLREYSDLVRQPAGADGFECTWYWGAATIGHGAIAPTVGAEMTSRGLERCPGEPRLVLARAIAADQRWPVGLMWPDVPSAVRPTDDHIKDVTGLYEQAMALPAVANEARIRAGWFDYRLGRFEEALRLLPQDADPAADRTLRYLHQLFRGHVLRALARLDEAAVAYETAAGIWPGAQSPMVALMTLRVAQGQRDAAEKLAETVESTPDDAFDPWWMYWRGDYRLAAPMFARLRALAK